MDQSLPGRPVLSVKEPAQSRTAVRTLSLIVACPLFLQGLDTTVMVTALPAIAKSLDVGVLSLNLAITAYLLSLAAFLPVSGWLAERFGARRMFCVAIALFSLGSALCGVATSLPALVAYRLLQGIGGAMMLPVGRLILLRAVAPSQIIEAMTWFTVPGLVARLVGPFFGGAMVTVASWPWIFWINLPFGVLGVALALRYVEPDSPAHRTEKLDLTGLTLLACGLVGVIGALEVAGKSIAPRPVVLLAACMGLVALVAYGFHGRRRDAPLIDLRIFRFASYRMALLGGLPLRVAFGASLFLLPLMLQIGFGMTALQAGLMTMATSIGSLCMRPVISQATKRLGFRRLMLWATAFTSLFNIGIGLLTRDTPLAVMFGALLLAGLFNAMSLVSLNSLGFTEIPRDRMSHATTASAMVQQLSVCLGVMAGAALLEVIGARRGESAGTPRAGDFAPAFVGVAAMVLCSFIAFRRIPVDEGSRR